MVDVLEGPRPVLSPNEIELIRDEYGPARVVNLLRDHPSSAHADLPNKPDKTNWVEQAGGLPSYIKRIAKHLVADQGMSTSHAIASAVNTVKRWAAGGGKTTAKTKAKAAAAVADWNRKRGQSRANNLVREVEEYLMTSQMPTRFVELSGAPPFQKGNQSGTPKKSGGKSGPPQSVINSSSSKTPDSKSGGGSSGPPAFLQKGSGGNSRSGVPQSVKNSSSPNTPNGSGGNGGPPSNAPSGSPVSKPTITDAASAKAAIAKAAAGNPSATLIAYLKRKASEFGVDASALSANGDHGSGGSSGTSSMPAFLGKGRRG